MRHLVGGAVASIEAHRRRIDDLNVYPVPDGDTGTNLTLTVRAVADELAKDGPDDRAGLAREIARAATPASSSPRSSAGRPSRSPRATTSARRSAARARPRTVR